MSNLAQKEALNILAKLRKIRESTPKNTKTILEVRNELRAEMTNLLCIKKRSKNDYIKKRLNIILNRTLEDIDDLIDIEEYERVGRFQQTIPFEEVFKDMQNS